MQRHSFKHEAKYFRAMSILKNGLYHTRKIVKREMETLQEYLDDLYEIARSRDDPMLLDSLENFLAATVDNLLRKQAENEDLETSLKRATMKNQEITSALEQELEQQVAELKMKLKQEEQRKLEQQKQEAHMQLMNAQSELLEMESKIKSLEQKVEEKSIEAAIPDQIVDEMQRKERENEALRSQLLQFQTQMALMRTEVAKMKAEYDDQSDRLHNERGTVLGCVQEQENLTRQLHLLHEANKKLHDTNDDLRSALERSSSFNEVTSPVRRSFSVGFSRRTKPNLHSSFRSDPGPVINEIGNHDFDDTDVDDISERSIIPLDDDVNENSLMSELIAADEIGASGDLMYGRRKPSRTHSLSTSAVSTPQQQSDREHFMNQLQVLCETNRRLGESNDELRQALGLLSEQLRPPTTRRASPAGCQSAPITPLKNKSYLEAEHPRTTSSPRKKILTKSIYQSQTSSPDTTDGAVDSSVFNEDSESKDRQDTDVSSSNIEDDETTCIETTTIYDDDTTLYGKCHCGKIIRESSSSTSTMCADCTQVELMTIYGASTTIYSNDDECECLREQCDRCTQAGERVERLDRSVQCEFERAFSESMITELKTCDDDMYTENPLEKTTQITDFQLADETDIKPTAVNETQRSASAEAVFETLEEKCANCNQSECWCTEKCTNCNQSECLCTNNQTLLNDINQSINQVPESTILTDSDDSNNYSDQETVDISLIKRGKPAGGESYEDATYETGFERTTTQDYTWVTGFQSSSLLRNIDMELSMYARRQPDELSDEYDMPDEELARLVDQTNDDEEDFSVSEEPVTVEEKFSSVTTGTRGLGVGADTTGESLTTDTESDLGPPERMFKLVLAGNAAVGKSSFIIRLCKNKFYSALNSTLGVDFQLKNMQIDGTTVALQLWDTAGQERFRSIAKSYFRKVDGVVLLYDVTCENSFMDVRDWLESIDEGTSRPVPVIICGNKTDLRQEAARRGMPVVTRDMGKRLANEVGALFIETSAKDGTNVNNACYELTRRLQEIEDKGLTSEDGINLKNENNPQKKSRCCR